MAVNRWIGKAQPVPAVAQFVPSSVEPGCEFVLTAGTRSISYRYPEIQPVPDDLAIERQQRVVDELIALLNANDFGIVGQAAELTYESDLFNGNPSIRVTGGQYGEPIALNSTAVAPSSTPIRITRLQEGTAGTDYIFTIKFPATPTGGTWGLTANGKKIESLAYNISTTNLATALGNLGLPCNSIAVSGSHSAGYTVTLTGIEYPLPYPPVQVTHGSITSSSGFGYRVEQIGSVGVVNQESYLPILDGRVSTLYRFRFDGRASHWFTGVATIGEIQDAAKSLFGTNNVTVSAYTVSADYMAVLEFHGIYAGQDVAVELETGDTIEELVIKQEAGGGYTGTYKQRFRFASGATGGTFVITDGTNLTLGIAWGSTAATINSALSAGSVSATCTEANTEYFDIQTSAQVGVYLDVANITIVGPAIEVTQEGRPDAQEIQLVALENKPTGGTFTLTFGGNTTTSIAYNASAATVQTALVALGSIGAGGVTVLGGDGGPYRVKWTPYATKALMTATSSLTLSVSPAFTRTDVVTGTGPYHFDNLANWSAGVLPADNDTIVFADGAVDCRYGLSQSALTPAQIDIYRSYRGAIGLPENREDGSRETLDRYLRIGQASDGIATTVVNIGLGEEGSGEGPTLVRLNLGDQVFNAFIRYSQVGVAARTVSIIGTASTNKVYATGGDIALGLYPDDTVNVSDLQLLPAAEGGDGLVVTTGDGATITALTQQGGTSELAKPPSSILLLGGSCRVGGNGKPNTVEIANADLTWMASGDLGKSGSVSGVSISSGVATITSNSHGLSSGDRVYMRGVAGLSGLDGRTFAVEVTSSNAFKLIGSNCSGTFSGTLHWGLVQAVIVRAGGILDFSQDARARDIVAPILVQADGQVIDPRSTISDLRMWPEQVDGLSNWGRFIELRRAAR
jgi:trimeric autotransporter adhesin